MRRKTATADCNEVEGEMFGWGAGAMDAGPDRRGPHSSHRGGGVFIVTAVLGLPPI